MEEEESKRKTFHTAKYGQ